MADDTALRLYRVRKTVCEMLHDRGYVVSSDDLKMTFDQFKEKFPEAKYVQDLRLSMETSYYVCARLQPEGHDYECSPER